MHTRVTIAGLLAVGILATGCSAGDRNDQPTPIYSSAANRSQAATPTFDAQMWKKRIQGLFKVKPDPDCKGHPSGSSCAASLRSMDRAAGELRTALFNDGAAAQYPEAFSYIQQTQAGYDQYVHLGCEGSPTADAQGSDCRAALGQVFISLAMIPVAMNIGNEDAA